MIVDLAESGSDDYVALKEIAERQKISKKYLEQIVPILTRGGILSTNRGYQGGYRLSRNPSLITCGEVLRLTEGSLAPIACLENGVENIDCDRKDECMTLPLWIGLSRVINNYLDGITVQDIIDQHNNLGADEYMI